MSVTRSVAQLGFPVVLWRENYVYTASSPLQLCSHPRSLFPSTLASTRSGSWKLMDANGKMYEVRDWERTVPFGGLRSIGLRLMGTVFAVPILSEGTQLDIVEFKEALNAAVNSRYAHDSTQHRKQEISHSIMLAKSFGDAVKSLEG